MPLLGRLPDLLRDLLNGKLATDLVKRLPQLGSMKLGDRFDNLAALGSSEVDSGADLILVPDPDGKFSSSTLRDVLYELADGLTTPTLLRLLEGPAPNTGSGEGALFISDGTGGLTAHHVYYRPHDNGTPFDIQGSLYPNQDSTWCGPGSDVPTAAVKGSLRSLHTTTADADQIIGSFTLAPASAELLNLVIVAKATASDGDAFFTLQVAAKRVASGAAVIHGQVVAPVAGMTGYGFGTLSGVVQATVSAAPSGTAGQIDILVSPADTTATDWTVGRQSNAAT